MLGVINGEELANAREALRVAVKGLNGLKK